MKAIILIELEDEHLLIQTNDLYDRLKGYKCDLRPLPQRIEQGYPTDDYTIGKADGWNACLEVITGETE